MVHSTVDLPRKVCNECINKLEGISLFIAISRKTNSYLGKNVFSVDQTFFKPEEAIDEYDNESSRYCRACLSSSDLSPFEEKNTLLQRFQEITKIDVRANTNVWIGISICSKCTNELQKATDFLNLSMMNNEVLQRLANIDTKKGVLRTDDDKSSECLMGMNDVKDECTDEYIATDIKVEMLFDDSKNRSFENFEETNTIKTLPTSIDIKEELLEHMTYNDQSNLESCILSRIESKSSEDIQEQIEIGIETDQLQSSKDKKFLAIKGNAFKCEYCSKEYTQKKSLQTHLFTHSGEKPFSCDYCDKKFTDKSNLQRHMLTHTGGKRFRCDYCSEEFTRKDKLHTHLFTHSGEEPFICDHCDEKFTVESNLRRHMLTHTREKPFKCDYCREEFTRKDKLQSHLLTHSGEEPFRCDNCDKNFSIKRSLNRHLLTHTGEKPFKCDHCDKHFNLNSNLKRHLLTHTGEKPFKCEYCRKGFSRKDKLQRHLLIHTGKKPFKCDYCGKRFTQNCNLKSHLITHMIEM